jgi:hypothetical protein
MKLWFLITLFFIRISYSYCQIVDDTTKLTNGYASTIYRLPHFSLLDSIGRHSDTSLTWFQESDEFLWDAGQRQKNLGYIGSPQASLFNISNERIGLQYGQENTRYLSFDPDSVRFNRSYNVVTRLKYNQGSFGRQWILVEASKNIATNFNVGINIRRLTSLRQIGVRSFKEKLVDQTAYCIHFNSSFFDNKYLLMGSFSEFRQGVKETGGLVTSPSVTEDSLFDFTVSRTQFTEPAVANEKRRNIRLYNYFKISNKIPYLQLVGGYDGYKYDFDLNLNPALNPYVRYDSTFLSIDFTSNNQQYDFLFLKPSLLYTVGKFNFEAGFHLRKHRYSNQDLLLSSVNEEILFASCAYTTPYGKVSINTQSVPRKDNSIRVKFEGMGIYASVYQAKISPSFLSQRMISNNFTWQNSFALTELLSVDVRYKIPINRIVIDFMLKNQTVRNGIFYSKNVSPIQEPGAINNLLIGTKVNYSIKRFNILAQVTGSSTSRNDYFPQPTYFARLTPSFQFFFKSGKYQVMPGFDFWYRDSFLGQAYDPSVGVFHLQGPGTSIYSDFPKHQLLNSYLWSAIFINVKINNTRGYVKLGNAGQGITGPGFFDVPFYPGQQRYFEFGIDWVFYD